MEVYSMETAVEWRWETRESLWYT